MLTHFILRALRWGTVCWNISWLHGARLCHLPHSWKASPNQNGAARLPLAQWYAPRGNSLAYFIYTTRIIPADSHMRWYCCSLLLLLFFLSCGHPSTLPIWHFMLHWSTRFKKNLYLRTKLYLCQMRMSLFVLQIPGLLVFIWFQRTTTQKMIKSTCSSGRMQWTGSMLGKPHMLVSASFAK